MALVSRIIHFPRPSRISAYIKSRMRPPDVEIEIICDVLDSYGLELISQPRNLPNYRRNRNIVLNTSAGKKVFKLYRSDWRISTIQYEHSILRRLAEVNFPAPRLVIAKNGETYINKMGKNYTMFDFMDGVSYASNFLLRSHRLKLYAEAGQAMANLHRQLNGFLPSGQHHLGFKSYSEDRVRDMSWNIEKVGEMKGKSRHITGPGKTYADWLIQNSSYILEELERLDGLLQNAPLPRLLIHGDYGLHNILFSNNGGAIPLDYELARLEWRLIDLVSCLSRLRYSTGQYDIENMQWFMRAYQDTYPLSAEEWRLFPQVWRYYKVLKVVVYWSSYFETNGPIRKLISARDSMSQADYALSEPDKLLNLNVAALHNN